jgi:hypothetical protein
MFHGHTTSLVSAAGAPAPLTWIGFRRHCSDDTAEIGVGQWGCWARHTTGNQSSRRGSPSVSPIPG